MFERLCGGTRYSKAINREIMALWFAVFHWRLGRSVVVVICLRKHRITILQTLLIQRMSGNFWFRR